LRKYHPLLNTKYKSAIVVHRKGRKLPITKDGQSSDRIYK
jgi:hypothetical protein